MQNDNRGSYTRYDNFQDGLNWKTILRDILIFLLIVVVFMCLTPHQKEAPAVDEHADTVLYLPKGTGKITQIMQNTVQNSSSASATKHYVMYDTISTESGTTRWTCDITGTFFKQGDTYGIEEADVTFVSYNTTFYKVEQIVTRDGDTIRCQLTVGKRFFYIPFSSETFEFSLTCNSDGTFS